MLAGLEYHLRTADNALRRHPVSHISRHAVLNARICQRLDEHIDVCRCTGTDTYNRIHHIFRNDLHHTKRFEEIADHLLCCLVKQLLVVADTCHTLADQRRRVRHRTHDTAVTAQLLVDTVNRDTWCNRNNNIFFRYMVLDICQYIVIKLRFYS